MISENLTPCNNPSAYLVLAGTCSQTYMLRDMEYMPADNEFVKPVMRMDSHLIHPYKHILTDWVEKEEILTMRTGDAEYKERVHSLDDYLVLVEEDFEKAVEFGAEMICLRLMAAHPDSGDRSPEECAATVKEVLAAVGVPLTIWGCGVDEKDSTILPAVSAAAKGENCLVGTAREKNYRTVVAVCQADGHKLLAESPLDINIAKQVNILCQDAGFPLENIVVFPTTGALGYGIEYAYSIGERQRLAALGGDKMMAMPVICDVGYEAWRVKEARLDAPEWGDPADRGPMWEATTAICLLQAGADIIRMRHPRAVAMVKQYINQIWG